MFLDALTTILHASISRYPEALAYLKSREVTAEDVRKYRIGYSKVVRVPEDNSTDRARFQDETWQGRKLEGKIIFPFQDALDRTVGLAGRSIESKEFKNFVTEEGKFIGFFFGLAQALPYIYETRKVYLVEGFFDLLAFAKVFPNTVATVTSGLNEAQHDQLSFYCDTIVACFDSDQAGRDGTEKAMKWNNVRSMCLGPALTGYKDPAECLEKLKLPAFTKFVKSMADKVAPF